MDRTRLGLAIRLAALFYGAGLFVLWVLWPMMQIHLVPLFPSWVGYVTGQVAYWGVYLTVGGMMLQVVPKYHRLRIAGDGVGCGCFLLNLLIQKNSGNVTLEVALTLMAGWSIWANQAYHQPFTATRRQWIVAGCKMAACYAFGLTLAALWPVDNATQYPGWYWPWLALLGALFIFTSLVFLEVRVMNPLSNQYRLLYGAGCAMLTLSYLGEYNRAGLVLNSSLACLMYSPVLMDGIRRITRTPEETQVEVGTV